MSMQFHRNKRTHEYVKVNPNNLNVVVGLGSSCDGFNNKLNDNNANEVASSVVDKKTTWQFSKAMTWQDDDEEELNKNILFFSQEKDKIYNIWFAETVLSLWQKQKLHFFLKSLEKSTAGARGFLTLENQGYGADYAFCSPSVQQFLNKIGIVDFLKKKTCSNVGAALVKTWFLKPFSSLQNSAFKHRKKWMQFFENSVDEISLKKLQRALQELQPQHLHDFVFKSDTFQFCTHLKSLRNLVDTFFFVSVLLKNLNASTCDKFFSSHSRA